MNDLPVILKLSGRKCLVVGGGKVALRRASGLADVGACVTVIAPRCDEQIRLIPNVTCEERGFADSDMQGVFLVVIATDDAQLNQRINALANEQRVLVNRADDPDAGDISIPAHAHCGSITVAVHTNRISALAAATIRDGLLEHIDPAWPALLAAMAPFRQTLQEKVPDTFIRQGVLKKMADEQAFTLLKEQGVMHYLNYCQMLMSEVIGKTDGGNDHE